LFQRPSKSISTQSTIQSPSNYLVSLRPIDSLCRSGSCNLGGFNLYRNHKVSYEIPNTISTRSAGIGYGSRKIFLSSGKFTPVCNLILETPPPNIYQLKSDFNKVPSAKAFSFGIAREAYSKVYLKENPARDPNVPGPG
jgi:hypothetical protein